MESYQTLFKFKAPIYSPIEDEQGNLFVVSANGDIYSVGEEIGIKFATSGQPTGMVFDTKGISYVADPSHQAILAQKEGSGSNEIFPLIKEYQGSPLKGPNSLTFGPENNMIFFTDSGQFGESNLENPCGSLYAFYLEDKEIHGIMNNCLAHPTGVAL